MTTIKRAKEFGGRDALQRYAEIDDPDCSIPYRIYLTHSSTCTALHDKFPKSRFHFIVLPRARFAIPDSGRSTEQGEGLVYVPTAALHDLRTLAKHDLALHVLLQLKQLSEEVISLIQEEMMATEGRTWPIQCGFHANESMPHVHLHVMSQDFLGPWTKQPKHWNTFHPSLGFFLHLDDMIAAARSKRLLDKIPPKEVAERFVKEELRCHRSDCRTVRFPGKNMAALKQHLEEHFAEDAKMAAPTAPTAPTPTGEMEVDDDKTDSEKTESEPED